MAENKQKVLFIAASGIGNYIMQAPTIAAFKKAFPDSSITVWVAPRGTKELAEADSNVDAVFEMPIQVSKKQHVRQIRWLRKQKFTLGIVLSPGQQLKSALYLFLAGIPMRVGAKYPWHKWDVGLFLTDAVSEKKNMHDIEQNLRLLTPFNIENAHIDNYTINIPEKNVKEAQAMLKGLDIDSKRMIVGLHAGSAPDLPAKRWPINRFAEVAITLIKNHNAHVLLFGGPDEEKEKKQLEDAIHSAAGSPVSRINTSLLTTAALMRRCEFVLTNDSGLMHLAAASGVTTFAIFGPTNEKETGPRGIKSYVIRALGTKPVFNTERNFNLGTKPHKSILAVTPEMVMERLRSYL